MKDVLYVLLVLVGGFFVASAYASMYEPNDLSARLINAGLNLALGFLVCTVFWWLGGHVIQALA